MNRLIALLAVALALGASPGPLAAANIAVPNASFESPPTTFAVPLVDNWQQNPLPDLNDPSTYQLGVFSNVPPPIDNCDGGQAAFLIVDTNHLVALFQDYDSTDYANPTPSHAFNAAFGLGRSYTLTVGVIGGGGGMNEGASLALSLYYRDALSNMVTVASTSIVYTASLFPSHTHFVDFQVLVPAVRASDPWSDQHIGIQLLANPDPQGGSWDVDNVRLSSTAEPLLLSPARNNGQFTCTLQSERGLRFEMLASTNPALPLADWTSLGKLTNISGTLPFLDSTTDLNRRFYRALQLP